MSDITVITNRVPRPIIDAWELSESERNEFDYVDWDAVERGEESASFFRYKGSLYDLGDAETWNVRPASAEWMSEWDGFYSQTFFSGVVVRYARDDNDDMVIVGRYFAN